MRLTRIVAAMILGAGLGLGGTAVADGPFRALDTIDAARGWEAVGRVDLGNGAFCTGALIAPDLVLTAAHCLYVPETGARIPLQNIEFLAGWRNGRADAYRSVRRVAQHPFYTFDGGDRIQRVAFDLAVLELERPVRNPGIKPFATAGVPPVGGSVGVVSYAQGRDAAPTLEEVCHVLAREVTVVMLSCNVDFGASGSPIFAMVDDRPVIVSVVSAKAEAKDQPVTLGTDVGLTIDAVVARLAGSDGVFRRRNEARAGAASEGAKFLRP